MKMLERVKEYFINNTKAYCEPVAIKDDLLNLSTEKKMAPPPMIRTVPSFKQVQMVGVKKYTMEGRMYDLTGLKITNILPLSPMFFVQNEFNLNPKPQVNPQNYMQMMMMNAQREPYFTTMLNYVLGTGLEMGKKPTLTLSTRANTNGMVEFSVGKYIGPVLSKLTTIARNQGGMIIPMFALELEHSSVNASHSFVLTDGSYEFSILQKIGKSLFVGIEYAKQLNQNVSFLNGLMKYRRNFLETYYMSFDEMKGSLALGQTLVMSPKLSVGSELELTDQGSLFSFGFKRRFLSHQLSSAINSELEVKSSLQISTDIAKLTLHLKANLKEEDFKTGIKVELGPQDPEM